MHNLSKVRLRYKLLIYLPWILFILLVLVVLVEIVRIWFGIQLLNANYSEFIRIISASGLIGFLTNWIAITMLFKPAEKRPLLGQGLIPAQKSIISEKLATAIQNNLINAQQIQEYLLNSAALDQVITNAEQRLNSLTSDTEFKEAVYTHITIGLKEYLSDTVLRDQFAERILAEMTETMPNPSVERMAFSTYLKFRNDEARSILNKAIAQLPDNLYSQRNQFDNLIEDFPLLISKNRDTLKFHLGEALRNFLNNIDIKSIILKNLNSYDENRLEALIKSSTMDQLNYIKYLGAVLGVLGGLFIWNTWIALAAVGTFGTLILLFDHVLSESK